LRAKLDKQVQEQLERFLSWLLDARWFPETNLQQKQRLSSEWKKLRRVLARMEAISQGNPDVRLQRGVAEWRAYESNLATLAKQHFRSSPHFHTGGPSKGSPEIAERLMCAAPILRHLRPGESAYEEIQRLLADPTQLPFPITVSKEAIQELQAGTIRRTLTASEFHYLREGHDIAMRRYSISVKAIQSSVGRLQKRIDAGKYPPQLTILRTLYAQYLWIQKGQAGFSDAEDAVLRGLVPTDKTTKDTSFRA
jgi:hypothetical protein